jgi:HEPN domain-containing protein
MPLDPEKVRLCREWLTIAASDLQAALLLNEASPPLVDQTLFHCQQCAEKTLKAFLVWHNIEVKKTHNLERLGADCAELDPSLQRAAGEVAVLTAAYDNWINRYPGTAVIQPSAEDADDACRWASDILRSIRAKLPAEVAP